MQRRLGGDRLEAGEMLRLIAMLLGAALSVVLFFVVLVVIAGSNPGEAFESIFEGSLGDTRAVGETLLRFAPLAIIALALVPSLRAGLFNIGAPGQIGMGALAAGMVSVHLAALPGPVLIVLAGVAGALAGLAWGFIPALMRARLGISEILSTLVFNFIAAGLLAYLLNGPLQGKEANLPQSETLPEKAHLPILISGSRADVAILIVPVVFAALVLYMRTRSGYRLRLFSAAPRLAAQAGASERRVVMGSMLVGAAAAGVAGWMQVTGVDHIVYGNVAETIGYTGLFVALLGGLNPVGVVLAAFFLAALLQGGEAAQVGAGVSSEVVAALVGFILLIAALLTARGRSPRRVAR